MKTVAKLCMLAAMVSLLIPTAVLLAPRSAHALAVFDAAAFGQRTSDGVKQIVQNKFTWIDVIKNTISSIAEVSSEIHLWMLRLKAWVFDPLAFVLSGNLLKSITAGVIDFVNGATNGNGSAQFVQNLQSHLLSMGDMSAMSFFNEFSINSNSPFGPTILSSVQSNYLITTSGAGFWAANRSTLPQFSQNPLAFVGGDFSQGGWNAWFALTTQPQNNPYTQYYRTQAELAGRTQFIVNRELTQLAWGEGMLSWCDSGGSTCPAGQVWNSSFQTCTATSVAGATQGQCDPGMVWNSSFQTCTTPSIGAATGSGGCSDGSAIKTPGSIIKAGLDRVLGSTIAKLEFMGDIGPDVTSIFSNIASIVQIASYGAELLGANGVGLFGASQTAGTAASPLDRARNQAGFFGSTAQTVNAGAAQPPPVNPNLLSNAAAAQGSAISTLPTTEAGLPAIPFSPPPPAPGAIQGPCPVGQLWDFSFNMCVSNVTASLSVNVVNVAPNGQVIVTFVNRADGAITDWIGLAPQGGAAGGVSAANWVYLNGTQTLPTAPIASGSITFTMPTAPGSYEFTLFGLNNAITIRSVIITVSNPSLTVSATNVVAGSLTPLTVTVVNRANGSASDWVGLDLTTAPLSQTAFGWFYLNNQQTEPLNPIPSATLSFAVPSVPGSYIFTLYSSNAIGTVSARSSVITVTAPAAAPPPTATPPAATGSVSFISGNNSIFGAGSPIGVNFTNRPGGLTTDWIAIVPQGGDAFAALDWQFLNGSQTAPIISVPSGTLFLTTPTTLGSYEVLLLQAAGTVIARSTVFTVTNPPSVTAIPTTVQVGGTLTVDVVNGSGLPDDIVAFAPVGSGDGNVSAGWQYLDGTQTVPPLTLISPARLTFTAPTTPGSYWFTLYTGGDIRIVNSSVITLTP